MTLIVLRLEMTDQAIKLQTYFNQYGKCDGLNHVIFHTNK